MVHVHKIINRQISPNLNLIVFTFTDKQISTLTRPTAATGQKACVVGSSLRKQNTKHSIKIKLFFALKM